MIKPLAKIISILLIVGLNWAGLSAVWQTSAYFNDTGASLVNTFSAATLNFSLISGSDFAPGTLNRGGSATRNISLQNDGSLDFQYKVSYQFVSGSSDLCNALNLTVDGYNGLLKDFNNYGAPFESSSTSNLNFVVTLPSDASDSLQGTSCQFRFVFAGWQDGTWGQGFSDTEEIINTISANYWDPPVVLNEILPNPEGDDCSLFGINGEWVEIYNKTSAPLDLAGWYIEDADGNLIAIQTTNTLNSSTTIGANSWLVVFMNNCILGNASDTVSLYNNDWILADSYSYIVPDYNINNTPGSTNDMVMYLPFDNDLLDQSGNGNNGTNNGAISTDGKINQGLSFDGTDDYVNCGTNGSLDIRNELTIEVWIKPDTVIKLSNHSSIVDHGNSYWFLILNTGKLAFLRFNQDDPQTGYGRFSLLSAATTIATGVWTHVVATYSVSGGNAVKLYINGQLSGSGNFAHGPIDSSSSALTIGNRMGLHNFDGSIDEVKIYNRALGASEVESHYGRVPENKSYARIPDGSLNWVDPFPTPGGPNVIGEQEAASGQTIIGLEGGEMIQGESPIIENNNIEINDLNKSTTEEAVIIEDNQNEENGELFNEPIGNIVNYLLNNREPAGEQNNSGENLGDNQGDITVSADNDQAVIENTPAVNEEQFVTPENNSSDESVSGGDDTSSIDNSGSANSGDNINGSNSSAGSTTDGSGNSGNAESAAISE